MASQVVGEAIERPRTRGHERLAPLDPPGRVVFLFPVESSDERRFRADWQSRDVSIGEERLALHPALHLDRSGADQVRQWIHGGASAHPPLDQVHELRGGNACVVA